MEDAPKACHGAAGRTFAYHTLAEYEVAYAERDFVLGDKLEIIDERATVFERDGARFNTACGSIRQGWTGYLIDDPPGLQGGGHDR